MSGFNFNRTPEEMQEAELDEYEQECLRIIELVYVNNRARELYAMDETGVVQARLEFYVVTCPPRLVMRQESSL